MRREFAVALLFLASVSFAAPQAAPPTDTTAPTQANGPIYKAGEYISAPQVKHSVEAQYTDKARLAKREGVCLIGLIVNAHGDPVNVHVVRGLGMGLDEKAIEAVKQYKFKPAKLHGKTPVPVMVTIEVDFRL